MADLASVQVTVYGRVQGVFFRAFTSTQARELGLTGYVRNLPDWRSVEVLAEGEKDKLERLIERLRTGPPTSKVDKVATAWSEYTGKYADFNIEY